MQKGINGAVQEKEVFVGTTIEEALAILAYRMKLTVGDCIELTDGTKAVVSANDTKELDISCVVPVLGNGHEYGYFAKTVPYSVIKAPVGGKCVSLDTLAKAEGSKIVRELIEDEDWQNAYKLLPKLKKAGMDVSKLVEFLKNSAN